MFTDRTVVSGRWAAALRVAVFLLLAAGVIWLIRDRTVPALPDAPAPESRPAYAVETPEQHERRLLDAICRVESNGYSLARGSRGERGPYQIGPFYWWDACEYAEKDWPYEALVEDPAHCEAVMRWYWAKYGLTTDEQRARAHNGGPRGPQRDSTLAYWRRVQAAMGDAAIRL